MQIDSMIRHHPIFGRVRGFHGARSEGVKMDYVGARFLAAWDGHVETATSAFVVPPPPFDEEYFEWCDILESVEAARSQYVMMELGAGYGRWGIRAGLAALRAGIDNVRLVFCEGLPKHAAWLRQALSMNGLSGFATLHEAAVAYADGPVSFLAESARDGAAWFGQGRSFDGAKEQGYREIIVPPITLEAMTARLDVIDLIDMDLQGAERELVAQSMDTLNRKVKRVHIGTHGTDIEADLRLAFATNGWTNIWDFGCHRRNETPYGPIKFVDGVQGWVNPRLA